MMIGMVLFGILVIAGILWLADGLDGPRGSFGGRDSAGLRILQERLARGEIDAEEYRLLRSTIEGKAA